MNQMERRDAIKELLFTDRNAQIQNLADRYHPSKRTLSPEQMALLKKLAPSLEGNDLVIMNSIISQFAL